MNTGMIIIFGGAGVCPSTVYVSLPEGTVVGQQFSPVG